MITTRNFLGTKLNYFFLKYEVPTQMSSYCVFFSASKVDNNHIVKQIDK